MSSNTMATETSSSAFSNTYQLLSDYSKNALNTISKNDTKYFDLLNEKESLSYHLLERDTELFKKKNELNTIISIQKDKENQYNRFEQNSLKYSNKIIEQTLLFNQSTPLLVFEPQKTKDRITLNLSNKITLTISKNLSNNINCELLSGLNKLFFSNKSNPTQSENLDAIYKEDPEAALLYLAYNL